MLTATLALALLTAPMQDPDAADRAAVMVPIDATFGALAARDGELIRPHVDTSGKITAVELVPGGEPRSSSPTWEQFIGGLTPGPERFEEIMVDPVIAIDGDIAMVWGEYIFRIDGQITHCGVDHFDLIRRGGAWKIVNLTWTQRNTGCDEIAAKIAAQ